MPRERRDQTLINAVLEIQKDISAIKTSQAVATTKMEAVEDHLKTLNGKVASQEIRQQEQAATQSLLAASIQSLQKKDERDDDFWRENRGKVMWGIIGIVLMLFYWLLTNNGFPNFLNH